MVSAHDLVVWLQNVDKEDISYVGSKAANLGELIQAGFPVPEGFAITIAAYSQFFRLNKLETKIDHLLNTINYNDPNSIEQVSKHIKNIINASSIPHEISTLIFKYYESLDRSSTNPLVAIRSFPTSEDSNVASFVGQHKTYLNISGEAALIAKIREAWASLFESQAMYYRHQNHISHTRMKIALVVQKMIESETSGVMFTVDPITHSKNRIVIEAIYGLGEYMVHDTDSLDHYEVDKVKLEIAHKTVAPQLERLVRGTAGNKKEKVPRSLQSKQKITDHEIIELSQYAKKLEEHYYFPQDCEWAIEKGKLYILTTKPITTIQGSPLTSSGNREEIITNEFEIRNLKFDIGRSIKPFLIGDPASPGIGIGHVKIIKSSHDLAKFNRGDILAAEHTTQEYVSAMRKAGAIITEKSGRTSHAAAFSREFGVPAVVGVPKLLAKITDRMVVTVNGKTGEITQGSLKINKGTKSDSLHKETKTKVLVNLSDPELAGEVADEHVDGVGLLRAEFMITDLGIHPKKLIHDKRSKEFTDHLAHRIEQVCKAFYPRPVLYRATDFKTNEYAHLKGGHEYEPVEPNPMLGYRGAYRYSSDPKVFELELHAIKKVHTKYNNLNLMVPFVRTVEELEKAKKIISSVGLRRSNTFKLFMACEIPSNVILIEEFLQAGIDGISIELEDLTMLLLGVDRDNEEIGQQFDEQNPTVVWALERVITACNKKDIPVSICEPSFARYPNLIKKLVDWEISSVSVSPDVIDLTRDIVYKAERE